MQRAGIVGADLLRGQLITPLILLTDGLTSALSAGVDALHPKLVHMGEAPDAAIEAIHDAGLRSVVWGVNSPEDVARMAGVGVTAIITDDPGMARMIVDQA